MCKGLSRSVPWVVAAFLATAQPVFAVDAIDQTLGNITGWVQGVLISLGVLGFVLGGAFFIFDHTIGGQERGKQFMVSSVGGVVLGLLAGPIVRLFAGFVAH
jgi:hypothetical protein